MDYFPQFLAIASVFLLGAMSPGPDFVAVTSHALASRRAGLQVALGVTAAIVAWATLAMFGFGGIVARAPWLYTAVRVAGALYLIHLGVRTLLAARRPPAEMTIGRTGASARTALRTGFLVGITNPKTVAFFASLFITVLPLTAPPWVQATTLLIIGAVALGWFGLVALVFSTGRVRTVYSRIRRWIDVLLGGMLVVLGFRLILAP